MKNFKIKLHTFGLSHQSSRRLWIAHISQHVYIRLAVVLILLSQIIRNPKIKISTILIVDSLHNFSNCPFRPVPGKKNV
jgi:hypothetical protein